MNSLLSLILTASTAMANHAVTPPVTPAKPLPKVDLVEVVCRVKAKEAAAHAFRSCMIDDKATQMQDLKKRAAAKVEKRSKTQKTVESVLPKKTTSSFVAPMTGKSAGALAETPKSEPVVEKSEVFKDQTTTVEVQTSKPSEPAIDSTPVIEMPEAVITVPAAGDKELETALEQIKSSEPSKKNLKRAILIEDDSQVPEPEDFQ